MKTIAQRIAEELSVPENKVQAAIILLDEGATVPFIARYRKEVTGGLDDIQLRTLEDRLRYIRELDERREVILTSIRGQNKLTTELEVAINDTITKTNLEDLYLPYRLKRRSSKAQTAKDAGLEPLALDLLENPSHVPEETAMAYLNTDKGIDNSTQALEGAQKILIEKFSEVAELLEEFRDYIWENAVLTSKVAKGKEEKGANFSDYFEFSEALKKIPSHRALAMFRGRDLRILRLQLRVLNEDKTEDIAAQYCEGCIAKHFNIANQERASDEWLLDIVHSAWRSKIKMHLEAQLLLGLRETAEQEAIQVFAGNLHDLLLAAPAGQRATIGLDPGIRTGVKVAVIDNTGKVVDTATIYPHQPRKKWQESIDKLADLTRLHQVELISIGNGTASRETDKLVADLMKQYPDLGLSRLVISEAGASVYSASELASEEFPDIDVSIRGAISIARRLQDPLAELVKIEPKSIGVGQYQHDVNKNNLARSLDAVVEDCVNAVGVDVNTASASLLRYVSGLNAGLAQNIVKFRDEHGLFLNTETLKEIPRLGEKSFEQSAGFLRIMNGDNPLDASAVHPEAYPVIERIMEQTDKSIKSLIGNTSFLRNLNPKDYTDEHFGVPTVNDILRELEKPGRDPRPEFKTPTFKEGVEKLEDLEADMILEGVITNVANFGAFVDIGVHHDGLVHISALSHNYVKDPRQVVKTGDVVKVKVLEIDLKRGRIALSMCLEEKKRERSTQRKDASRKRPPKRGRKPGSTRSSRPENSAMPPGNIMAEAFANARKN
ncbi:MAG: RNA-binding transcriptional accessory protein [Thiomargarita sp.]|nr:RNA-binding transcriptional accessory protein [Thiomargarita sp.]